MSISRDKKRPQKRRSKARVRGNFWEHVPRPCFVLAPMANVTDSVFRSMIAKYGKPDVMWTEFVSADGLCSPGRDRLMHDLVFSEKERPVVAQLFTGDPDRMKQAVRLCAELGFDGVDINMGCPDRAVEKQGSGAGHIKDPQRALEVLAAAREGWVRGVSGSFDFSNEKVSQLTNEEISILTDSIENNFQLKDSVTNNQRPDRRIADLSEDNPFLSRQLSVPISVKTRLGYNKVDMKWLETLLSVRPALPALTVHLRTRKEMSEVPAHWELMPDIVKLRDEVQQDIPVDQRTRIIGNGDVQTLDEAREKCADSGCDGVMIGRGIFGTPWFFEKLKTQNSKVKTERTPEERLEIMLEHTKLFEKTYCRRNKLKNFATMKKHFKAYVSGWDGAKELRMKLMETENYRQAKEIVDEFLDGDR